MNCTDVLNSLQKRNNRLKSKLTHEQLKYGNYSFDYFKKFSRLIVIEYRQNNSLLKSALNVGINQSDVWNWYAQGKLGNELFKQFYLEINRIDNDVILPVEIHDTPEDTPQKVPKDNISEGEYVISQYGDGWSYKTFIDGEKIFLISDDLKKLKDKVKSKRLPLD